MSHHWRSLPIIRNVGARPRFTMGTVLGLTLFAILPHSMAPTTRALIGWNCGAALYLALGFRIALWATSETMRRRALLLDEGRFAILIFTAVASLASLAAIVHELSASKTIAEPERWLHVGLAALTVVLSWAFMHMVFAQHYAHEFYSTHRTAHEKGLEFPGTPTPLYWDFYYFSYVIGAAAQTADVSITATALRKTATAHCTLAFFFNTFILALTINIGASLF